METPSKLYLNAGESETTISIVTDQGITFNRSASLVIPQLPADITELDDEGLMVLFSQLTAYSNFLAAQMACAMIDERTAERTLDTAESIAILNLTSGRTTKDTMTIVKAQVASQGDIINLKEALSAKYNYRKLVEVMVNNIDRDTNLVSRELTRRTSGASYRTRSKTMFA